MRGIEAYCENYRYIAVVQNVRSLLPGFGRGTALTSGQPVGAEVRKNHDFGRDTRNKWCQPRMPQKVKVPTTPGGLAILVPVKEKLPRVCMDGDGPRPNVRATLEVSSNRLVN